MPVRFKNMVGRQYLPLSLKKAVDQLPLIIGIAPNAWSRIVPGWFLPKYKIVCYRDRQDTDYIVQSGIEVFSIQQNRPGYEISPVSATGIISSEPVREYFLSQTEPFALLVYRPTKKLEEAAEKYGFRLIANDFETKETFENKRIFREILKKAGIEPIPGENILIEQLTEKKFMEFQKKFGRKIVLQLAEVTYGGGSGTLFIDRPEHLNIFRQRVAEIRQRLEGKKKKIETVNVTRFVEGDSPSVVCCATRFGTLVGPPQTQILDIAEVGALKKGRSGNFAGHDWSYKHYPGSVQDQARAVGKKIGDYFYKQGYQGIFGLDLIVEEKTNKVWVVECNPRFTDAFPMISLLLMGKGVLPMDIFHILEHLGVDYEVEFEKIDRSYRRELEGSQIILHSHEESGAAAVNQGILRAGVHRLNRNKLEFVRPGFSPFDLESENEFLFTEGLPKKPGEKLDGTARICRLIRKGGMLSRPGELRPDVKQVIELAYKEFRLSPLDNKAQKQASCFSCNH